MNLSSVYDSHSQTVSWIALSRFVSAVEPFYSRKFIGILKGMLVLDRQQRYAISQTISLVGEIFS